MKQFLIYLLAISLGLSAYIGFMTFERFFDLEKKLVDAEIRIIQMETTCQINAFIKIDDKFYRCAYSH